MTEKRQTSQGYIIRILQHFANIWLRVYKHMIEGKIKELEEE
jgi:predicted LPLAT superfamily acyltransferase